MSVLYVQHLMTLTELTRILKLFKQRKHADKGYSFEVQDLGAPMKAAVKLSGLQPYSERGSTAMPNRGAWWHENAYLLRVYREANGPVNRT